MSRKISMFVFTPLMVIIIITSAIVTILAVKKKDFQGDSITLRPNKFWYLSITGDSYSVEMGSPNPFILSNDQERLSLNGTIGETPIGYEGNYFTYRETQKGKQTWFLEEVDDIEIRITTETDDEVEVRLWPNTLGILSIMLKVYFLGLYAFLLLAPPIYLFFSWIL